MNKKPEREFILARSIIFGTVFAIILLYAGTFFGMYLAASDSEASIVQRQTPVDNTCDVIGQIGQVMAETRDELRTNKVDEKITRSVTVEAIKNAELIPALEQIMIEQILPMVYDDLSDVAPDDVKTHLTDWCSSHIKNIRPGVPNRSGNIFI